MCVCVCVDNPCKQRGIRVEFCVYMCVGDMHGHVHACMRIDVVMASCKRSSYVIAINPSVERCLCVTRDLYVCVCASVQVSSVCECVHALLATLVARNCMRVCVCSGVIPSE